MEVLLRFDVDSPERHVASTAMPMHTSICWAVLNSPDATPASLSSTFVVATSVSPMKVRPMPIAATRNAGRMTPA